MKKFEKVTNIDTMSDAELLEATKFFLIDHYQVDDIRTAYREISTDLPADELLALGQRIQNNREDFRNLLTVALSTAAEEEPEAVAEAVAGAGQKQDFTDPQVMVPIIALALYYTKEMYFLWLTKGKKMESLKRIVTESDKDGTKKHEESKIEYMNSSGGFADFIKMLMNKTGPISGEN